MSEDEITQKIQRHPVTAGCRKGHEWLAEYWDQQDPQSGKVHRTVGPIKCPICGLKYDYLDVRHNGKGVKP